MPHSFLDLPAVYDGVIRPVAFDAARFLAKELRLSKDTRIVLPGTQGSVSMDDGNWGDCCNNPVHFEAEPHMVMNFTEVLEPDTTLSTSVKDDETWPIFYDKDHEIIVRPTQRIVKMSCDILINFQSRTDAQRMIDWVRSRISGNRDIYTLELQYHYMLPDSLILLLMHLHKKMQDSECPDGTEFGEWFTKHTTMPNVNITTLTGTAPRITVTQHQLEAQGWFDFTDSPPEPTPSSGNDASYSMNINFQFNYSRPQGLFARWPLLVNNQVIDKAYRNEPRYPSFWDQVRKVSLMKEALRKIQRFDRHSIPPYIVTPEIDDWVPKEEPDGRSFFFQGLIRISKANGCYILNLCELGKNVSLSNEALEYIDQIGDKAFHRNGGLFDLAVYENNTYRPIKFHVEGTKVYSDVPLRLDRFYHVRLGIVTNFYFMSSEGYDGLRRYPRLFYQITRYLMLPLVQCPYEDIPRIGVGYPRRETDKVYKGEGYQCGKTYGGTITNTFANKVMRQADKRTQWFMRNPEHNMRTVMFAGLIASRKEITEDFDNGR